LRSRGDLEANRFLLDELARERPSDPVLSEEVRDDEATTRRRLASMRAWIIDPLDGTREFGELSRTDWAVHVALCLDGRPVCGAVSLPALGITLSTALPPPLGRAGDPPRLVVSRTRPPVEAHQVAAALGAKVTEMGSAGAKIAAVIRGEADIYLHAGGQHEWDSAAPVAVALSAGLSCTRLDGSPLRYNQPDPMLPDLVVCRPELAEAVLAALA
jgi:3'(2'), 5'-bisphosphate nucleotidase